MSFSNPPQSGGHHAWNDRHAAFRAHGLGGDGRRCTDTLLYAWSPVLSRVWNFCAERRGQARRWRSCI